MLSGNPDPRGWRGKESAPSHAKSARPDPKNKNGGKKPYQIATLPAFPYEIVAP